MFEPWRLAIYGLILVSVTIGGCVFGYGWWTAPVDWTVAFGKSRVFSPQGLLAFHIAMAIIFFIVTVNYTIQNKRPDFFWLLTHWSLYLELFYICLLPFTTWSAMQSPPSMSPGWQPMLASVTVVLMHFALPASVIVFGLYWTLERPLWKLCPFNDAPDCKEVPGFNTFFAHLYNMLLLILSLWVTRIPWFFHNSGWVFIYGAAYVAWTVLHFLFKLGKPLYGALDWSKPESALTICAVIVFIVSPAVIAVCWAIAWARDRCAGGKDMDDGIVYYTKTTPWSGP